MQYMNNLVRMVSLNFRFIQISFIVLLLWVIGAGQVYAQEEVDLSSPSRSLKYYILHMDQANYHPDKAAIVFYGRFATKKEAQELAIKLKQIIDGKGIFIDLGKIPNIPDFIDSLTHKHLYPISDAFPELYLEKIGQSWYFSKTTTKQIIILHKATFPFGADKLINLVPKAGNRKVLGIKLWQYFGILILVVLSFIIHKILNTFISIVFTRLLTKFSVESNLVRRVKPAAVAASYAIVFMLLKLLFPIVQLPAGLSHYVNMIIGALVPFFVMISLYRFVDVLDIFFTRMSEKTESTLDDQLVPLIRKALKAFVVIIGVLIILQNLDVDILPLLAGLSVGGLAVALAAQDTIKNLLGSIMIFVDKPFQVGHWITSGDIDGTVEEVGIRSTRIRTFRNSIMYVPNGKLADSMIDNHGLRVYRRFYTQISITYNTPADLIELFVEGLRQIVKEHHDTRKDYYNIYLNDMAGSSLNIMFYIFFEVPDWSNELRARHEILLSVIRLAEELGINFAFHTQTLHIENMPGQLSGSPTYKSPEEVKRKLEDFFKKEQNAIKEKDM